MVEANNRIEIVLFCEIKFGSYPRGACGGGTTGACARRVDRLRKLLKLVDPRDRVSS